MRVAVERGDIAKVSADVLIVSALKDGGKFGGAVADIDIELGGEIADAIASGEFKGAFQEVLVVRTRGRMESSHVVVVGLGKKNMLTLERIRQAAGSGFKAAKKLRPASVAMTAFGAGRGEFTAKEVARSVVEGALLANYHFDIWKTYSEKNPRVTVETLTLVEIDQRRYRSMEPMVDLAVLMAEGTICARDLVNATPMQQSPEDLKNAAEEIAEGAENITVQSFGHAEIEEMGMGSFLAVAQGADTEPYFVHLVYKPDNAKKKVALVGKAITFDSGGLSLKPADAMTTMKCDMAGAAAVLGVFSQLEKLQPNVEVHGIFAACENMPSGSSYRPGDIVIAKNGMSIEVINTDAEGRMTLADALCYAEEQKPDMIIELSTLTGSAVVALGEEIAGVMTDDDKVAERLFEAAEESGEELWELPLFPAYNKLLESKVADVKHVGGRWGGALTAGLFLKRFVKKTPWVHIDIAGPSYAERDYLSYVPHGGTGFMVRTLLSLLKRF